MTLEGTRGGDAAREAQRALLSNERQRAEELAARLGLEFVDLTRFRVDSALFHSVSFEVMLRYGFVPLAQLPGRLQVAMKDPGDIGRLDELELLLGQPVEARVATAQAVDEVLQKAESSQRVLEEATEDFRIQLVQEDEAGEEVLSIDRISADSSPIIKLIDSTLFNAIQRRASDIHIESRDHEVVIK